MLAHLDDLRAEVDDLTGEEREAWLAQLAREWRAARLAPPDAALCVFAEKLTLRPAGMRRADVVDLREVGFDDVAIHEAIQVIAYFNYINRIADALHVDLEPGMAPYPDESRPPSGSES